MMQRTQFDAKTGKDFTAVVTGPSYAQRIEGPGYFIIVNTDSKYVSFSKSKHDICFGDIVSDIIPSYTNEQYAKDYGDRVITEGTMAMSAPEGMTVREYVAKYCRKK